MQSDVSYYGPESTAEAQSPWGAAKEMRLLVPPGVWLPPGMPLLTLLLVAVCGVPAKLQSLGTLPRNISKQAKGYHESGGLQGPDPGDSANNGISEWDFLMVWTPWSPCSGSCGRGTQTRSRSCGYACTTAETQSCRLQPCPGTEGEDPKDPNSQAMDSSHPRPASALDTFSTDADLCDRSLSCKSDLLLQYVDQMVQSLPNCPCSYPEDALHGVVTLFDWRLNRKFRWRDASGPQDFLAVYRPAARFCLRSVLSEDSPTLAAQQCCYDAKGLLLTRGPDVGYPELFSPNFSPDLDLMPDQLPWILCKTDWSRYQGVLPPNNGMNCPERPPKEQDREVQGSWTSHMLGFSWSAP